MNNTDKYRGKFYKIKSRTEFAGDGFNLYKDKFYTKGIDGILCNILTLDMEVTNTDLYTLVISSANFGVGISENTKSIEIGITITANSSLKLYAASEYNSHFLPVYGSGENYTYIYQFDGSDFLASYPLIVTEGEEQKETGFFLYFLENESYEVDDKFLAFIENNCEEIQKSNTHFKLITGMRFKEIDAHTLQISHGGV